MEYVFHISHWHKPHVFFTSLTWRYIFELHHHYKTGKQREKHEGVLYDFEDARGCPRWRLKWQKSHHFWGSLMFGSSSGRHVGKVFRCSQRSYAVKPRPQFLSSAVAHRKVMEATGRLRVAGWLCTLCYDFFVQILGAECIVYTMECGKEQSLSDSFSVLFE